MRNKEEFENAVYCKLKSHEKRRRRNIAAITSTCAALVICVSLTTVLSRHNGENDEAAGTSFASLQTTIISLPETAPEDENAAVCESPDSAYIAGEPEETFEGASETAGVKPPETICPEPGEVIRLLIGEDIYVFSADKLSDVMSILTKAPSDGTAVTLYVNADAEHYTVSNDNIAKLLDIIQD